MKNRTIHSILFLTFLLQCNNNASSSNSSSGYNSNPNNYNRSNRPPPPPPPPPPQTRNKNNDDDHNKDYMIDSNFNSHDEDTMENIERYNNRSNENVQRMEYDNVYQERSRRISDTENNHNNNDRRRFGYNEEESDQEEEIYNRYYEDRRNRNKSQLDSEYDDPYDEFDIDRRRDFRERDDKRRTEHYSVTKPKRSFFSSPFKRLDKEKMRSNGSNYRNESNEIQYRRKTFEPRNNERSRSTTSGNDDKDEDLNKGEQSSSAYNPINYQFPSKDLIPEKLQKGNNEKDDMSLPETGWNDPKSPDADDNDQQRRRNKNRNDVYSNPRRDAIARYTSTKMGKMKLAISSATCGAILGTFVGKSTLGHGKQSAIFFAFLFWFMGTFLRDAYGEMVRSLALGMIYLLSRTRNVRKSYKTGVHLKAIFHLGGNERVPFPPLIDEDGVENMWKYTPQTDYDPDFDMVKSLICLVIIGSFCGGNVPLIPTWMGSMAGASTFGFLGISKNSRGDLMRTMGMRVVATAAEALDINAELNVTRKVSVVAGKLLDKALILDRKHRIKDKIVNGATWIYDRLSSTVRKVQDDMNQDDDDDRRREIRRDDRSRPPPTAMSR